MDRVYRTRALDVHELVHSVLAAFLGFREFGGVGAEVGHGDLVAQIVLDSVGEHEVTVGQTLHER